MAKKVNLSKCQCNFVPLHFQRELGFHSHLHGPIDEFLLLAEDKAAVRDGDEITCKLGSPRSTFLMVFSPDGTKIASTHGDHKIYVCNVISGKCLHTLEGHPRTPWCIAFHPSSNDILASGCLGGEVRIWDLHGGSEVWVTQQNTVIASLAFHPFDQVLVIATYNELCFWDWSQPQPFAKCKTASEREKIRYVKFDPLGHKLITGVANLPIIQSSRPETTRTMVSRYSSLIERYNRILEVRRELQRYQTSSTSTVGTDPVATNERPTSPTQVEALQSAREYAQEVTADMNRSNIPQNFPNTGHPEDLERNSWRYRDPYNLLRNNPVLLTSWSSLPSSSSSSASSLSSSGSSTSSTSPAAAGTSSTFTPSGSSSSSTLSSLSSSSLSSLLSFQQEFINSVSSRLRSDSNQASETSLPSSLIQALLRLQRSLELLEPRVSSVTDRRNPEQIHLRQRIEEILNRLFNLYASITPLRILMDEVFQDFDREVVLAEVNRDVIGSLTSQTGIDIQLQELRQHLTRLLERIFALESDQHNQETSNVTSLRDIPSSASSVRNHSYLSADSVRTASQGMQTHRSSYRSSDSRRNLNQDSVHSSLQPPDMSYSPSSSLLQHRNSHLSSNLSPDNQEHLENNLSHSLRSVPVYLPSTSNMTEPQDLASGLRSNLSIPQVQIDPPEPLPNDLENETQPLFRPRSPPLGSILQNQQSPQQQYMDYQAASSSSSGPNRAGNNSVYLHPNYVASLFEESIQRTNALQLVINRAIAGTFLGSSDFAVVNNVMSLTHRIQCWDFSRLQIPSISDPQANLVVSECKIHNDASVDISSDGHLLATLVPGTVGLPSATVVGIYSLEKSTFGCCLYSCYFGPNAISVSLSPLSQYIVVGLASRRVTVAPNEKQVVAQIYKLLTPKIDGQENMELVRNIEQCGTSRLHISLNSIRWLPSPGQGIVYGTNRGELRICRPGPYKSDEHVFTNCKARASSRNRFSNLRSVRLNNVQSTATQTITPQTQSAGTQTGMDFEITDNAHSRVAGCLLR